MGQAFTAMAQDAQAFEYNPAAPASLDEPQFWFSHLSYFEDINAESANISYPGRYGAFSMHTSIFHSKDNYRDRSGTEGAEFRNQQLLFSAGHSVRLKSDILLGGSVKFVSEKLENDETRNVAADFGAFYTIPKTPISMGASIQNIGSDGGLGSGKRPLPLLARAGATYLIGAKTLFAVDAVQPLDEEIRFNSGIEYWAGSFFAVRAGFGLDRIVLEDYRGVTAGLGFSRHPFKIDYAFIPLSSLGMSHRVSLGITWGSAPAAR